MSLPGGRTPEADCLAPSLAEWVPRALQGLEQPAGGPGRCMGGGGGQGSLVEMKYWWD